MLGYGQCLRYPKLFYGFCKSSGSIFIIFIAGYAAVKVIGQYFAACGKRGVKVIFPVILSVYFYVFGYFVGNNIAGGHKRARWFYR
jgi:hypothetical protein